MTPPRYTQLSSLIGWWWLVELRPVVRLHQSERTSRCLFPTNNTNTTIWAYFPIYVPTNNTNYKTYKTWLNLEELCYSTDEVSNKNGIYAFLTRVYEQKVVSTYLKIIKLPTFYRNKTILHKKMLDCNIIQHWYYVICDLLF